MIEAFLFYGQCAVSDVNALSGRAGDIFVVCNNHNRQSLLVERIEQFDDIVGRGQIKIAGWFITEEQLRRTDEGARNSHPLLFTAESFVGKKSTRWFKTTRSSAANACSRRPRWVCLL